MDLLLEWQRLRRIEKLLIEMKTLHYAPVGKTTFHDHKFTDKMVELTHALLNEVPGKFLADSDEFAEYRKKVTEGESK